MNRIGTYGRWKKTSKGWQYILNDDQRKVTSSCLERSLPVESLSTTRIISPTTSEIWQCVMTQITSSKDLQNLAATCRSLYKLVDSELGWSYLIRTKFGYRLWLRYVRQMFHPQSNQQLNPHFDIDMMEKNEIIQECTTLPATFFLNRTGDQFILVKRAILRCYRYYLEKEASKDTIHITLSEYAFRPFVSFDDVHGERLNDVQRRTISLTKLIYFHLAERRHVPVIKFNMIYPHGSVLYR
jgi:hypothetical protein